MASLAAHRGGHLDVGHRALHAVGREDKGAPLCSQVVTSPQRQIRIVSLDHDVASDEISKHKGIFHGTEGGVITRAGPHKAPDKGLTKAARLTA